MEGYDNEDYHPKEEQIPQEDYPQQIIREPEQEPYHPKEQRKGRKLPLMVGLIIGLFIGYVLFSPNILGLVYDEPIPEKIEEVIIPEVPIYENYTISIKQNYTICSNEELRISIAILYYPRGTQYDAEWFKSDGNMTGVGSEVSSIALYDNILSRSEELTKNQLKWFEYICKSIIE